MTRLLDVLPDLARELAHSLRLAGHSSLAEQLDEAEITRVTFDESHRLGYVYVAAGRVLNIVETQIIGVRHGQTLVVETPFDTVIDTDNFDRLAGIEILAPGTLAPELKRLANG